MPRWVYALAFLFVLFLIYSQPSSAGQAASGFADFAGSALSSIGEFMDGAFSGSSDNGTSVSNNTSNNVVVEGGSDIVTHTHDGLAPHSHGPAGS